MNNRNCAISCRLGRLLRSPSYACATRVKCELLVVAPPPPAHMPRSSSRQQLRNEMGDDGSRETFSTWRAVSSRRASYRGHVRRPAGRPAFSRRPSYAVVNHRRVEIPACFTGPCRHGFATRNRCRFAGSTIPPLPLAGRATQLHKQLHARLQKSETGRCCNVVNPTDRRHFSAGARHGCFGLLMLLRSGPDPDAINSVLGGGGAFCGTHW
jgi:hypothetical protein